MRAVEYVEAFPREFPAYEEGLAAPWLLHDPPEQSLGWSYAFGKLLHDQLGGVESDVFTTPAIDRMYRMWNVGGVQQRIDIFHTSEHDIKERNTANFHALNSAFMGIWQRFMPYFRSTEANQTPINRPFNLRLIQEGLAIEAVTYMLGREQYIEEMGGTHGLFNQRTLTDGRSVSSGIFTETVAGAIGIIEEFEVAIAGIEALRRHPELLGHHTILLPTPIQFEKTNRATNADFIYYDPSEDGRAVGLQSKMGATREDVKAIDPERVVLIDGKVDLSNVRPVRREKGGSKEIIVAWPGLIAAKIVSDLRLTKDNPSPVFRLTQDRTMIQHTHSALSGSTRALSERDIMVVRMERLQTFSMIRRQAQELLGETRVDLAGVSRIIAERVALKL